ncbi:endospore germination permease [Clostridium septicum]|uniref:endospore germination permease n=1 Tax=Clostridium septicum TaxID=1504 RepID=UPI000FF8C417|nr:endospore germination permease [Clostridium septicum]QAS60298.1 spore gernimation protein [Clostridium septicum]
MNKLSSKHFILFIIGATLISLKTYPSLFISIGGRDTWLCALVASIIFILYVYYIMNICKNTDTYDIKLIFTSSLSKTLGKILLFIFSINLFLSALESAAIEANALHSTFFIESPVWYALIFFLLPSIFLLNKNVRTIVIFVLVGVGSLIINSILFILLTQGYKNMDYVLPVLGNGLNKTFFITIALIIGSLSSFAITIPFMKYMIKNEHIKIHSLYASCISTGLIVVSILGIITSFGPLRSANIFYPEFVLGQRIQIGGFLEFGELFFLYQTVVGFFIKYILSTYGILIIYNKLFSNRKLFTLVYTFLIFVFSTFLGGSNFMLFKLLKYNEITNLIIFFVIPVIIFTIYNIKFKHRIKANLKNEN